MGVTTAADTIKEVTTPLSDADVESLKTGDRVVVRGGMALQGELVRSQLRPAG